MTLSLKQKYIKTIPINRTRKLKETEARSGTKHAKTVQRGGIFGLGLFGSKAAAEKAAAEKVAAEKAAAEKAQEKKAVKVDEVKDVETAPITRVEPVTSPDAMADAAAATIVATLANTATAPEVNPRSQCPDTEAIKKNLTNIGITSFEKTEGKGANSSNMGFEMQKYDKREKGMQKLENAIRLLHVAGCAVPVVSSYAEVILGLATGLSNFNKSRALTYLASQCLSYVATISKNLAEMLAFYNNDIVKNHKNNIAIDNKLYGALQKNLYTFLYFLIDSINFRINDDVGLQHYSYWHTFLLKVDFSKVDFSGNSAVPIPPTKYRYSCKECIPSDTLREKMRTTLEKKYVTLENQSFISTITGAPRPPEFKYYGFCNEDVLTICKNYNDNIMRLIELNMYILIKSAYDNRKIIPILKYTDETVSARFFNAVFSTTLITHEVKEDFINDFKKDFKKDVDAATKQKTFSQRLTEVYSRVYKRFDDEPDLQVSFGFLIQLNRIFSELQHPGFSSNVASKAISSNVASKAISSNLANKAISSGSALGYAAVKATVKATDLITLPVKFIISDTKLQYEELLREYTLMTGNFLMLTSSFILDKAKFNNDETEQVNKELTEKLKSLADAIHTMTSEIDEGAKGVEQTATHLVGEGHSVGDDSRVDSQANTPANTQGPPEGGRSLSKKKYNYSQKRKTKRNKRKRRAL